MGNVETKANQLLAKKYFIDSSKVLFAKKKDEKREIRTASVIDSSNVVMASNPINLRHHLKGGTDKIKVNVVRDGNRIKTIRITCPCGRHAELDCEYAPEPQSK